MSKRTQNLSKEEPMKYTLDTDFSSLSGPKAANWIMGFQDMAEDDVHRRDPCAGEY